MLLLVKMKRVALPAVLGEVQSLITDNGFFSQANVIACDDAGVQPLLALKRESHHRPVMERLASDAPESQTTDPVVQMAHRLSTRAGRALLQLAQADGRRWSRCSASSSG